MSTDQTQQVSGATEVVARTSPAETEIATAYRAHGAAVFRTARQYCGAAVAEEVTQEVFVYLWQHPERFEPTRGTMRAYLVTVARCRAIDAVRSESSRHARERRINEARGPKRQEGLDSGLLAWEEATDIAIAVDRLPEAERAALVVAFYGGLSYRQAAVVLGEAEGTTKSRIRAALRHLAAALAETSTVDRELAGAR